MQSVKVIEKLFEILECFTPNQQSLSINDLQQNTGYPKSTIFRLLSTLQNIGYIEQNPENQRYSLGFKFFHLGYIVQNSFDFRSAATPIMKQLAEEIFETVELNIVNGMERVCIDKVDGTETIRNIVRIGERNPLHLGASGKILLAFLTDDERSTYYVKMRLSADEQDRIEGELQKIQQHRFSSTLEERIVGSFSISAPIFDFTGKVVAGLTIAGPIQRLSEPNKQKLIEHLLRAVQDISMRLGYREEKLCEMGNHPKMENPIGKV
jgi:DNA-binding IclR family transcriptional regulator